jgi:DNA-binding XRE family transcriptional regulator
MNGRDILRRRLTVAVVECCAGFEGLGHLPVVLEQPFTQGDLDQISEGKTPDKYTADWTAMILEWTQAGAGATLLPPMRWGFGSPVPVGGTGFSAGAPEGLTLPLSAWVAIDLVEQHSSAMVEEWASEIETAAEALLLPELRGAILNRPLLWKDWPFLPWNLEISDGWFGLEAVRTRRDQWPGEVAPMDVDRWARPKLEALRVFDLPTELNPLTTADGNPWPSYPPRSSAWLGRLWKSEDDERPTGARLQVTSLALLYLAELQVDEDRRRPFGHGPKGVMAADTTKESWKILSQMSSNRAEQGPGGMFRGEGLRIMELDDAEWFELAPPADSDWPRPTAQLTLNTGDWDEFGGAVCDFIGMGAGAEGLRQYHAMNVGLSAQGRTGRFTWTLDAHMDALRVSKAWRQRPENRTKILNHVLAMLRIQVRTGTSIKGKRGRFRTRSAPMFHVLVTEREVDSMDDLSRAAITGLELAINPVLYGGVRRGLDGLGSSGAIGRNWFPIPSRLATIDSHRFGPALYIGTNLLHGFHAAWKDRRGASPYARRKVGTLLNVGRIKVRKRNHVEAVQRLERNLAELVKVELLSGWEYATEGEPHMATVVVLRVAEWIEDRTIHGVRAIEGPPSKSSPRLVVSGDDLRAWRKSEGLTQAGLAERLKVHRNTIKRAEKNEAITPRLRAALASLSAE